MRKKPNLIYQIQVGFKKKIACIILPVTLVVTTVSIENNNTYIVTTTVSIVHATVFIVTTRALYELKFCDFCATFYVI